MSTSANCWKMLSWERVSEQMGSIDGGKKIDLMWPRVETTPWKMTCSFFLIHLVVEILPTTGGGRRRDQPLNCWLLSRASRASTCHESGENLCREYSQHVVWNYGRQYPTRCFSFSPLIALPGIPLLPRYIAVINSRKIGLITSSESLRFSPFFQHPLQFMPRHFIAWSGFKNFFFARPLRLN